MGHGQITRIKYGAPCTTRTCDPRFRNLMSDPQALNKRSSTYSFFFINRHNLSRLIFLKCIK